MSNAFDIVVIGAGAAGVGATRELAGSGLSCLLLEASQRVGGRAWTVTAGRGLSLDLGCGWLHSAERNSWSELALSTGTQIDRREPAWGKQYKDLGFSPAEQKQAKQALSAWNRAMHQHPPLSDRASDSVLESGDIGPWRAFLEQIAGAYTGKRIEEISVADYMAYLAAEAEAKSDWRLTHGYGSLVASGLPQGAQLRLATPVTALTLDGEGVGLRTPRGDLRANAAIITVSTNVLANAWIDMPAELEPWLSAAAALSLGANEKLYLEILRPDAFEVETRVVGDPRALRSGAYYIRPLGMGVIEGFFCGEAAEWIAAEGPAAAYDLAINQLAALFGQEFRETLRPIAISSWREDHWIQGSYSCAAPGHHSARERLAQPFDDRIFFAGEATHPTAFTTAHGALDSGVRAAREAASALSRRIR